MPGEITQFEWDENKRRQNLTKHGVDFLRAALVFDGRPAVMIYSPRTGEDRWQTTADIEGRLVPWSGRGAVIDVGSFPPERHVMTSKEPIVKLTLDQIRDLVAGGEDRTDWSMVDRKTEAELDADIASAPDSVAGSPAETWVRVPPGFDVRVVKKSV